ncbi:ribonuclease Z, partial [Candidatus Bathyarchaeota archaeon]
ERNPPSLAIRRKGELFIFDCGEGTQRQLLRAGLGFPSRLRIFITHLHGDHVFGLPGLIHTLTLLDRREPLEIYGPPGMGRFLECVRESVGLRPCFELLVHEVGEGVVLEGPDYVVKAAWVRHSVPTLAYALEEKPRPGRFHPEKARALGVPEGPLWKELQLGRPVRTPDGRLVRPEEVLGPPRRGLEVVYAGDTGFSGALGELARGADLLIHECTFDDEKAGTAAERLHSTPSVAAEAALRAGARRLVLTHISARYKDPSILLEQARARFPDVLVAEDLMRLELRHED